MLGLRCRGGDALVVSIIYRLLRYKVLPVCSGSEQRWTSDGLMGAITATSNSTDLHLYLRHAENTSQGLIQVQGNYKKVQYTL
jgi:hypothetical protein